MNEPRYPFVAVDVPAAESEELGATLFELGASGVEPVHPRAIMC